MIQITRIIKPSLQLHDHAGPCYFVSRVLTLNEKFATIKSKLIVRGETIMQFIQFLNGVALSIMGVYIVLALCVAFIFLASKDGKYNDTISVFLRSGLSRYKTMNVIYACLFYCAFCISVCAKVIMSGGSYWTLLHPIIVSSFFFFLCIRIIIE